MSTKTYKKLLVKFPDLKAYYFSPLNRKIFDYFSLFVSDFDYLVVCLLSSVFKENRPKAEIKRAFNHAVFENLLKMNDLLKMKEGVFRQVDDYKSLILLFLCNYKVLFDVNDEFPYFTTFFTKSRIRYALRILDLCDTSEIRNALEDKFFYIIEPELFNKYCSRLFLSRRTHRECENNVMRELKFLLSEQNIDAEITCRLKSVYGIHRKVSASNILLAQVLDIVGLRIITEIEDDCYEAMKAILGKWKTISSKVKDYIALPKENGYRSIHLTILIEDSPVEIQIRTREMHEYAQFGPAAHGLYKSKLHSSISEIFINHD